MQELDFHEVADEFIQLANDLEEEWAPAFLSAAILYAAARYNAFHYLQGDDAGRAPQEAADYFMDQYRRMFLENVAEIRDM